MFAKLRQTTTKIVTYYATRHSTAYPRLRQRQSRPGQPEPNPNPRRDWPAWVKWRRQIVANADFGGQPIISHSFPKNEFY